MVFGWILGIRDRLWIGEVVSPEAVHYGWKCMMEMELYRSYGSASTRYSRKTLVVEQGRVSTYLLRHGNDIGAGVWLAASGSRTSHFAFAHLETVATYGREQKASSEVG